VAQYPHDLTKARALLQEIGIEDRKGDGSLEDADGNRIEFVLNTMTHNTAFEKTAVLIASDLEKIGFKVIVQSLELNTLLNKTEDTTIMIASFWDSSRAAPILLMHERHQVRRLHASMVPA